MPINVTLDNYIQVACLPSYVSSSYPSYPAFSYAAGWGSTSFGGQPSNTLRNVKLNIYDPSLYCTSFSNYAEWNKQICAGEFTGGKDTCQGDSGGPLAVTQTINGKNKYVVVGITSYGDGCGDVYKAA